MKLRNIIFWSHLVAGVAAGIIILVMSVTGAILAFEHQIVDFAERDVQRVTIPSDGMSQLSINHLMEQVKQRYPEKHPTSVVVYSDPGASLEISFGRDDKVYVNPYTGDVLGSQSKVYDWIHVIESWHRWLGSRELGRPVTGVCNLLFLFLAISGFYLWWPRQWNLRAIKPILFFNGTLRGKPRDWNWHNVIGFWCAPFFIIITLTGAVMSYSWANNLLYRMAGSEPPAVRAARNGGQNNKSNEDNVKEKQFVLDYDHMIMLAQQKTADWVSLRFRLPQDNAKTFEINVEERDRFYPAPRSTMTVDTKTSMLIKWKSYKDETRGRKWRTWARYLHTGEAAGIVGQVIGFIVCLGASVLVWTGLAMAWRRFFTNN